ncbi:hypothetical protein C8J57DRAFT_1726504 [Mycena rebaudengoi]|nr:hypothetical protein C8J57DRAFT_1726504 [Mycena rebaudengoi]
MARRAPRNLRADLAYDLPHCLVCNKRQDPRTLDAHQAVCRANKRSRDQMLQDTTAQKQRAPKRQRLMYTENMPRLLLSKTKRPGNRRAQPSTLPLLSGPDDFPFEDDAPAEQNLETGATAPAQLPAVETVRLPSEYILTVPHPHSMLPANITLFDDSASRAINPTYATGMDPVRPWAPFRCFADYSFTSNCIRYSKSKKQIQEELDSLHSQSWAGPSKITMLTVRDMEASLEAARKRTVQFERTTIPIHFEGETKCFRDMYEVSLDFRDPWKVVQGWVCDKTLAPHSTWFSVKKYKCRGGTVVEHREQLFDEPCTGKNWWDIDDLLPGPKEGLYPSCYLPIHIWLDKGQVSTKVKMHPILIRGLWINSAIRNATGNGGCALLGYIVMPPELRNIDAKSLASAEREDFAKLRALIYNRINAVILDSLKHRSRYGDTFRFGDGRCRTAYPGIFIESMDFQELAAWLAMRSAAAKYPCPKCLVPQDRLCELTKRFQLRTPTAMKAVLEKALGKNTKKAKEEVLKGSGLHDVEQILWEFAHSDPYKAVSYDTLHWTDLGKFGKHLWIVIKMELTNLGKSNEFNEAFEEFPRWRGLRHISAATLIDYAEGNVFLHMLMCILPSVPNSGRNALYEYQPLDSHGVIYEIACRDLEKDFNFLKQHYTSHAADDIREKGTTNHMTTCIGESFQQVVARHYTRTNGREAEQQMVKIDENEEAIAELDMLVADHHARQKEVQKKATEDADDEAGNLAPQIADAHWRLGAPNRKFASRRFEAEMLRTPGGENFQGFDVALRVFLATEYPDLQIGYEKTLHVQSFGVIHIEYQSKVDWSPQKDILRCAESFYGRPRHDCVLYNLDVEPLSLARLLTLFRVSTGDDGESFDLAYVRRFKNSKWKPRTTWQGCRVVEEVEKAEFLPLTYITRGALLPPARGTSRRNLYFAMDTADDDMFLRLNNIE